MYTMSETRMNRSYSITNVSDQTHTSNGRCPDYALTWRPADNKIHWPHQHDYFLGNGQDIDDESKELREILSKRLSNGTLTKHNVFCDLDGVLADFEEGFLKKWKKNTDEMKPSLLWALINKSKTFFETLPWTPRGKELWSQIKEYNPIILTGVPRGSNTAMEQKRKWCQRELGEDIDVICCSTKDKPNYCLANSILIDDRLDNFKPWTDKGGKFIIYNEDDFDAIIERINRHMECDLPSP